MTKRKRVGGFNKKAILISGSYNAGKDYFADKIVNYTFSFDKLSFADEVKKELVEILDLDVFERKTKELYRETIIRYAEKYKLNDERYWANKLLDKAICYHNIVIPDFRFIEEYQALLENGYDITSVFINRGNTPFEFLQDFKFDHIIDNNGTLEEFNVKCNRLISELVCDE
jgi:hypothetical protein